MNNKRLDYLDMVKGIGIFLVVLGHMEDIATGTRIWISSFHMPLFFVVSGLLIAVKNEQNRDIKEIISKKFRGLIIPYLWFSLSYFIVDIANLLIIKNIDTRTFIIDTISSITFYGKSVLWFLPALFIASVVFIYLKKKLSDKLLVPGLLIIAVISFLLRQQIGKVYDLYAASLLITSLINILYIFLRAFVAMSFVGYAFYIRKLYEYLQDRNEKFRIIDNRIVSAAAGIVMIALNVFFAMKNQCVDLHNIILNNVMLYYLAAIFGCYGIILLCKALPVVKPITYYGKNSIIVMACHLDYYFLYAGIRLAWVVDAYNTRAKHYVFVAVSVITVFVLSTIIIEAINRFFPFVLGKKRQSVKNA